MTQKKSTKKQEGPPQALISRITFLQKLLTKLPDTLPLNPDTSLYNFSIDSESIKEFGALGAFSKTMETCFETFKRRDGVIEFTERGRRLEKDLIGVMKVAVKEMSDKDREVFQEAWLERLIKTAERNGVKVEWKKRKNTDDTRAADATSAPAADAAVTQPLQKRPRTTESVIITVDSDTDDAPNSLSITRTPSIQQTRTSTPATSGRATHSPSGVNQDLQPSQPRTQSGLKQASLAGLWRPLKDWSAEEREALQQRERDKERVEHTLATEREEDQRKWKKEHQKELARERQRRHRAKRAEEKEGDMGMDSNNVNDVLMQNSANLASESPGLDATDLAELSRPGKESWHQLRNGKLGGTKQARAKRTNWFHPFLWVHIDSAMRRGDWSPAAAARILQREHEKLFKSITRATVWKWKAKGLNKWSDRTTENLKRRHALAGTGRAGILAKHPEVVTEVSTTLRNLRISGIPINVCITRSIMLAVINKRQPEILSPRFQCSEKYVRTFLQSVMNYTPRQATRAAAHIPPDAADVCERTFFCLVYAMKWENIPACLTVNVDQMGMYILPSNSRTFHNKGANQVDAVAKDEKRAYTLLVASTPAGDILPFQQVWGQAPTQPPSRA
ncbi:hypothetical protein BC835DRAFT_1308424 [Cytidiella melzeri]|nr:hypothetical protein BC835DRAFT_1308424 [Cytidiella melzeri]